MGIGQVSQNMGIIDGRAPLANGDMTPAGFTEADNLQDDTTYVLKHFGFNLTRILPRGSNSSTLLA